MPSPKQDDKIMAEAKARRAKVDRPSQTRQNAKLQTSSPWRTSPRNVEITVLTVRERVLFPVFRVGVGKGAKFMVSHTHAPVGETQSLLQGSVSTLSAL